MNGVLDYVSGSKNLWIACLLNALKDINWKIDWPTKKGERHHQEYFNAQEWFMSDRIYIGSFCYICQHLNIDSSNLRNRLIQGIDISKLPLGEKIKFFRKRFNLSQKDFAKLIGGNATTISLLEQQGELAYGVSKASIKNVKDYIEEHYEVKEKEPERRPYERKHFGTQSQVSI